MHPRYFDKCLLMSELVCSAGASASSSLHACCLPARLSALSPACPPACLLPRLPACLPGVPFSRSLGLAWQDNKDLYAEEAAAQREAERQRMLAIPGLIAPASLQEDMTDM